MKEDKINNILLISLLCIGAVLRLYHPMHIPFTADEFDALARTKFHSFSELIAKGVIIDAHPAGVQVFLYYWTKLFGYSELIVKLPFICCGILSVWYIYRIGKIWFNPTVGLIAAAYITTIQYTVMYSQIARPYSSGMLFTLAMVFYWTNFIFKPEKNLYRNLILYILFSALCAYNHHFTLMIAGMVGVSGIFFINRKYLLKYVLGGLAIFVLYIPHLRIFFYQLHVGGLPGVFGKPHYDYIIQYLKFVFNFSWFLYLSVAILFLAGLRITIKRRERPSKFMLLSLLWFFVPFLAGFFYSVLKSPVLEYSSLCFSLPFLLFSLFGWLPDLSSVKKTTAIGAICAINVFSLVQERKYYKIFYKSRYEQEIMLTDSVQKKYGVNNCLSYLQMSDDDSIPEYYFKKNHINLSYSNIANTGKGMRNLIQTLEKSKDTHPYLSIGTLARTNIIFLPIILNYYPYLIKQNNFDEGAFYLLTNKAGEGKSPYIFQSVNDFEKPMDYWSDADNKFLVDRKTIDSTYHDTAANLCYKMDSLDEWAPAFTGDIFQMTKSRNNLILVSLSIFPLESMKDVEIVSLLKAGDKDIYYGATPATDFIADSVRGRWVKAYHAIKLPDIYLNYWDVTVKVYLWNRGKRNFYMDDFSVKTIKGNPLIYWMIEKI